MRDWSSELRAIADGRLLLNVRNGVTVSRSMLAMIADEIDALRATSTVDAHETANVSDKPEGQQPVEDAAYWKGAYDRMSARNATMADALILAVGTLDDLASGVGLSRPIEQIIRELNDVASSGGCVLTRPSEQAMTEAMVEAAAIAISGGRKDLWDGFDLFKRASFRTRAMHALKAAMEARG